MSNERPEDRWKREKEYQPPTSDQGDQTVIDAFWMAEKRRQVPGQQGQQYTGGQPNNQQYDQPIEIKTELFDQPVEIKTELFDWMDENRGQVPGQGAGQGGNQYGQQGQPNGQEQWMAEKRGPVPGQQNTGGQQYTGGQPNNQPVDIKTELFDWMDENRGQVPGQGAGQGGNQYGQQGQPNGQEQWMAEKRGPVPGQQNPNGGQPGRQGGQPNGQEQWMAEKRGGPTPGQNGQANQYRPSGQVGPAADPNQWMREKQGGPVPFAAQSSADEAAWHQEKNFKAPSSGGNRNLYFILGGVGALVVAAIVVVVILLLAPKNPSNPTATATAGPTTAATSNTTAAATTASAARTTAPVTTAPATEVASTTPAATTTSAGDSARLLSLAQDAANNSRWQDVVNSLELLAPSDPNFSKAKPLLVKAYVELGKQAVAVKTNSQASANLALTNFRKANALDPNYEGLAKDLQRADTYAQGLLQYQSELYSQAVDTIKPLYDEAQLKTEGTHYRNTADILYDSYLKQGDKVFNVSNADALAQARNFYSLALAVDAPNKDEANSKLQQVTAALKLLSATPKK
jgi:hypothetical protein